MSKETLKLALEALKNTTPTGFNMESDKKFFAAIKALEEALAKQEQGEPDLIECGNCHEGLADMEHVCKKCLGAGWVNNPKQEQGEPVAWMHSTNRQCISHLKTTYRDATPLYTTPQQRTWVGLTESDRRLINFQWQDGNGTATEIIDLVEAKLKEKNI